MASALENFVNNVRTMSSAGNYQDLADSLNDTIELLSKNWNILDNVLETLDVQQHSLGVLYVLIAKFKSISNSNADEAQLFTLFKDFIQLCNGEQVRLATHAYYELCHLFTNYIVEQPLCFDGISILSRAIEKIRLHDKQLTAVHADLCQLSLKAKYFDIACKFLDVDITAISTGSEGSKQQNALDTNNDAKYFLLYFYYGGMIYTCLKNFERALYFYEVCIATPAMAMSQIMLEAYKKFILVSLILHGKISAIPKHSSQVVSRYMKPLAQVYHDLANAYASSSSDELGIFINKYSKAFLLDSNMGLVKQVATSLIKKNIQRLTMTFLTLSLSDVASRVQLRNAEEAESYIVNMIKSGEIFATINQKDGMVVFKDNPENYDSPEMFLSIRQYLARAHEVANQFAEMDEKITLNPLYIKKVNNSSQDVLGVDELPAQHSKPFSDPTD